MNSYPTYKDSGIEWVGDIPEHWNKINIQSVAAKNRYSFTGGPFGSDLKFEEYTNSGVRIIQLQNIGIGQFLNKYKIYTSEKKADDLHSCNIFPNDILIAKMADPVARACLMPDFDPRYLMASDGIRLEVNSIKYDKLFLIYAINSSYFRNQAEQHSTGTTRLRIGLNTLKKLKLFCPNLQEQTQIANFLNQKTTELDTAIEQLQQLIALLQEERSSLINEAVTKGIDPDVPMKDSGIEWIGEVPEHWEVKRFKYWFDLITEKSEHNYKIGLENIESWTGRFIQTNSKFESIGVGYKPNDILFGKLRPYLAKVYHAQEEGSAVGDVFVFRSRELINTRFAFYKILNHQFINLTDGSTYGAKMPRVNWSFISNMIIVAPSVEEQKQIVLHIEKETTRIDTEIDYTQQEITLLQEYKQSLITEAVTGKIDVRGWGNKKKV